MVIRIIGKFNFQFFPLDEKTIEIDDATLSQIGITKCFDVENNCVIDYDNTQDLRRKEAQERIIELKELLKETDFKAIKYSEGCYTEQEYQPIKQQRQEWRDEINRLETELGGEE